MAAETAATAGLADKLSQATYPFDVARAGAEHLAQPELSVHSLAYFYNWCFAQVQTRYSWKWDGDMVLTTEGEVSLGDLGWQVGDVQSIIRVPRHGLYLDERPPRLPRPRPAQRRGVGLPDRARTSSSPRPSSGRSVRRPSASARSACRTGCAWS